MDFCRREERPGPGPVNDICMNKGSKRWTRWPLGEKQLWSRMPEVFGYALAGAFCCGLLTHGMALFNKLSWHDDIFSLFMTGTTVKLGRWMLHVIVEFEKWFYGNGQFSIPAVNGMYSLVCIGLSAGLLVSHWRIRSRSLSALTGIMMAVFPVITGLFSFMFTVHYYMLSLLMIVGGSLLICAKGKAAWGKKLAGVLLCGCAVGIYQAFIPIMLMIILIDVIMDLIQGEEKVSTLLGRVLILALCVAGAMGVYFAGSQYFLWKENLQLDSYMGISEMGTATLGDYLNRVIVAYREFFHPTHFSLWDMYPQAMFNVYRLMLCLDILLGLLCAMQTWKKSPVKALLLLAALALVPLGCNFIFVMSEEIHSLMVYGQVMQMVLLVCLVDKAEWPVAKVKPLLRRGTALLMALGGIMYFRYDNQCYLKAVFQQQEAISWNTTLVTRIESIEGFRDELPVAFVNRENMQDRNLYNLTEFDFLSIGTYDNNIQGFMNDWAWKSFMERWCGFGPQMVDAQLVENWPEVQAMPSYPDAGSIQILQDVIVVKF